MAAAKIAAGFVAAVVAQGQQAEAFLGFGDLQMVVEQAAILGGGWLAGQQIGARQAGIGIGDGPLRESPRAPWAG